MESSFKMQIKVQRPVAEVFDAVYDPEKLSSYFTNGGSSGPLDEGTSVEWRFADNADEPPIAAPVMVLENVAEERIVLEWQGAPTHNTTVEFTFESMGAGETVVRVSESGWQETDLAHSYGNCFGWSFMITALKAFVEHGINLRQGAFGGLYSAADKLAQAG
jgi:uncharacterized protein YndB with AHSA1/START domain